MSSAPEVLLSPDQSSGSHTNEAGGSVSWLGLSQEAEWDAFVRRNPRGSIYHTTEWKAVIEQAFPHIRGRFLVLREGEAGSIQAGLPAYQVNSWLLGHRLVSIPFATVCDPLVSTVAEWAALAPALDAERIHTRSRRSEVRATLRAQQVPPTFERESLFRHHELALDGDFDALCKRFDKQSVRQKAEKARRAGVVVSEQNDLAAMAISDSLLAKTRRRLSLPPMPFRFFESMQKNLHADHLKIFLAHQNSRPVACHIILIYRDLWISEYSANDDGAMSGVNQLLYLETIRRAHAEGARSFSFGRTSVSNEGLLSYKRRWGTAEEPLTDYTYRPGGRNASPATPKAPQSEQSPLYKLCSQIIAKAPMPVCKLIGNFCYRHLG